MCVCVKCVCVCVCGKRRIKQNIQQHGPNLFVYTTVITIIMENSKVLTLRYIRLTNTELNGNIKKKKMFYTFYLQREREREVY